MAILKKKTDGGHELLYIKDFSNERQVELEIELDEGEYVILPRTSGCGVNRPGSAKSEKIRLVGADGNLHPIAELTVRDIFRRLDKAIISNSLDYEEFKEFYAKIGVVLSEADFKNKVLKKFCHNSTGAINRRGFCDFWIDLIKTKGEDTAWSYLKKWGYDQDLYPVEARCFMFTIHSLEKITINMVPQVQEIDLEKFVNLEILNKFGEVFLEGSDYKVLTKFFETSYTFAFGLTNTSKKPKKFLIDCSTSTFMIYSEPGGKIEKIIQPGETAFMMHSEAAPGAETFTRGC